MGAYLKICPVCSEEFWADKTKQECCSKICAGTKRRISLRDRFETKFVQGADDECWPWTGASNGADYGIIAPPGGLGETALDPNARPLLAHRISYELYVGPIPAGMVVDHVKTRGCKGPPCVNWHHLEAVTNAENARRGKHTKLSYKDVAEIRHLRELGVSLKQIGKEFNVGDTYVSEIARPSGKRWRAT